MPTRGNALLDGYGAYDFQQLGFSTFSLLPSSQAKMKTSGPLLGQLNQPVPTVTIDALVFDPLGLEAVNKESLVSLRVVSIHLAFFVPYPEKGRISKESKVSNLLRAENLIKRKKV